MTDLFHLLKAAVVQFGEDRASRLGAAIAYYAVFAMAPMLVIAIAVAGFVFGRDAAEGQAMQRLAAVVGPEVAETIQAMLARSGRGAAGVVASALGVITLLLAASGLVVELKGALNTIWEVEPRPGGRLLAVVQERVLAMVAALGLGFLLMVTMIASAAVAAMNAFFGDLLPVPGTVLYAVDLAVSLGLLTLVFALVLKGLPDTEVAWRDVWLGAAVTSVLFIVGKFAIGFYLGQAAPASSFGAAGSLVVLLLWVYYSAQIFFFGAEFTQVYANRYGSRQGKSSGSAPAAKRFPAARSPEAEGAQLGERERQQQAAPGFPSGELERTPCLDSPRRQRGRRVLRGTLAIAAGVLGFAGLAAARALRPRPRPDPPSTPSPSRPRLVP